MKPRYFYNIPKDLMQKVVDGELYLIGNCRECGKIVFCGDLHERESIFASPRWILCEDCMFTPKMIERLLIPERTP